MSIEDFLITFRADTAQALTAINSLASRVQTVDAQLNAALGRLNTPRTARSVSSSIAQGAPQAVRQVDALAASLRRLRNDRTALENDLANLRLSGVDFGQGGERESGLLRRLINVNTQMARLGDGMAAGKVRTFQAQFDALAPSIDRVTRSLINNVQTLRERQTISERTSGAVPALTAPALGRGFADSISLMRKGILGAGDDAQFFADRINALPPAWDRATVAFGHHARRIAEGIIIYDAFGRAVQGVADTIANIAAVQREQIRFEAVVGERTPQQQEEFVANLGDIAVRTNTQMSDLASVLDTVAASMQGVGTAAQVAAAAQEFLNDVGQFTNITQRDVATETDNLLGLFNLSGDSVTEFSDRIGRIVVAGKSSSSVIQQIADGLSEAGRSAASAGFDFDILTAVIAQIVPKFKGALSGREIGAAVNTFIGKMGDPNTINKIKEFSDGLVQVTDAAGNLRPASDVFLDLAKAADRFGIDSAKFGKILDQIVPPLNPGARATVKTIISEFIPAIEAAGPQMKATAIDAKNLSDALVSGPAETVSRALIALSVAAQQAFSDDVIAGANVLASLLSTLTRVVGFLGTGLGGVVIQMLAFVAGAKVLQFGLKNIGTLLLGSQIRAAAMAFEMARASGAARAIGTSTAVAAGQMRLFSDASLVAGTRLGALGAGLKGLAAGGLALAKSFAPLLAIMAFMEATNFASNINSQSEALASSIVTASGVDELSGIDKAIADLQNRLNELDSNPVMDILGLSDRHALEASISNLKALRENFDLVGESSDEIRKRIDALKAKLAEGFLGFGGLGKGERDQAENELDSLNRLLSMMGDDDSVSINELSEAFTGLTTATEESATGVETFDEWMRKLDTSLVAGTDSVNAFADAEQRAAAATEINAGLTGVRASLLNDLLDQLSRGSITLDEFNAAQGRIGRSSELASKFIAAFGSDLSLIPGLQERIAATGEDAATALTKILSGGDTTTIDQRLDVIEQMIEIQEANLEAAESVENNPIIPTIETEPLQATAGRALQFYHDLDQGTVSTAQFLRDNKPTPEIDLSRLREQLREALTALQALKAATGEGGLFGTLPDFLINPVLSGARSDLDQKIEDLREQIKRLEDSATGSIDDASRAYQEALRREYELLKTIRDGDSRLGSMAESKPQTALVDVGELSARQVRQAISIARQLQAAIPGASKEAADETVALIQDARFLQFIRGLDQRFLAEAIQELTEIERRRLELEQQRLQDVTRSIVTQVGPIQSLVSSPVLAAGGGLLSGSGLNADPRLGNITINVPINWSGMSLTQLQNFIYKAITSAYIAAGRGG